jgi:hypothetical protein
MDFIVFLRKISFNMKRLAIIASLCLMLFGFAGKASAQFLPDVPDMKGKITKGGDIDFGVYGRYLNFAIAPQVGYRIFSPWEVGVRGIYNLNCYFNPYGSNDYYHYFGVAPYTNFQVYKGLFAHVEYENLYGMARYQHETYNSEWFRSLFVGGGYRSYYSDSAYYYLMVLYNLSWGNLESWGGLYPYASPIAVRVGFCF